MIMKSTRYKIWAVLPLLLAIGWSATAQRNRTSGPPVPGPNDYNQFAQFITERNIFDPARYARYTSDGPIHQPTPVNHSAPSFTLVGTMSYEKGMFAFFDGNQSNLRKVLYQSDGNVIANFTVAEITSAGVKLQTADKKQTVVLKIGQGMRLESGSWQLVSQGGFFGASGGGGGFNSRSRGFGGGNGNFGYSASADSTATSTDSSSPDAGSAPAPSPALEGNDVLKKLMQQREQELK